MQETEFNNIIALIREARNNAVKAVNTELINLYWNIGAYINKRIADASWGDKTVNELAVFIEKHHPELKGFTRSGLYRMRQFYESYVDSQIVAPLVRQMQSVEGEDDIIVSPLVIQFNEKNNISSEVEVVDITKTILVQLNWTLHLVIFSRCRMEEEREFYIRMAIKEKYSKRELERQISASLFERMMMGNKKISPSLKEIHPGISNSFKDSYVFEFLNLPEEHSESDLQKGLIRQMRTFILELGKDFLFIGEEYKVQVGNGDFYIDLLFYHRGLQCLVAFELKNEKFMPEYLGKLNFYLEALDRDVKKRNENPSIGVLLCKDNDIEIVEYALSRSLSPTLVAEYKTQLPDKKLLQQKLHEIFQNSIEQE